MDHSFTHFTCPDYSAGVGLKPIQIAAGSPWEYGYVESFKVRLRDEPLVGEIYYSLKEAQIIIEKWRRHCNTRSPQCAP